MKLLYILFGCFFLKLITVTDGAFADTPFRATTTIGTFNTTFAWRIENFDLIKWSILHDPKPLVLPVIFAQDNSKHPEIYSVNCSIVPVFSEETVKELYFGKSQFPTAIPKITCQFNPSPNAVTYSHIIDGKEMEGIMIFNEGKNVEVIIEAVY